MNAYSVWLRTILILSAISCSALLLRLWAETLARSYRFFTLFLAASTIQALAFLPLSPLTTGYAWAYFISNPILWILSYFVVLELYRLILEDYPGISSAGRKGVTWSLGIAILIAIVSVVPDLRAARGTFPFLRLFYSVERSVILALLLFLILIQLFLARYKLNLSRNRKLYSSGYALYFGIGIAADIIQNELLGGKSFLQVSFGLVIVANLILLSGTFLLSRAGETRPELKPSETSADQERLLQQLADINRMLTRAARSRG